jgi:hypothetical protein
MRPLAPLLSLMMPRINNSELAKIKAACERRRPSTDDR